MRDHDFLRGGFGPNRSQVVFVEILFYRQLYPYSCVSRAYTADQGRRRVVKRPWRTRSRRITARGFTMRYLRHVRLLCVTMSLASIILEIPVLSSSTIQGESQQRTTRDQNYAAAMSGLLASHREMLNNLQEYLNTARTSTAETTKRRCERLTGRATV